VQQASVWKSIRSHGLRDMGGSGNMLYLQRWVADSVLSGSAESMVLGMAVFESQQVPPRRRRRREAFQSRDATGMKKYLKRLFWRQKDEAFNVLMYPFLFQSIWNGVGFVFFGY